MAERRMFAKTIVTSDAFLDMPLSARCLYFTLGMFADDDGFVNNPRSIMRQVGASIDDLNILMVRKFIISFESGVIVIKHWRINNYLRNDRYQETKYLEEKKQLQIESNGAYRYTSGIPSVYPDKDSIGKDSIDKNSINTICAVPETDTTPAKQEISENVIITFILNDKSEFPITEEIYNQFIELYPNVDVMQELRNIKGWCMSNPTKRKTKRGAMKFVNSWLSKEQDKARFNYSSSQSQSTSYLDTLKQAMEEMNNERNYGK